MKYLAFIMVLSTSIYSWERYSEETYRGYASPQQSGYPEHTSQYSRHSSGFGYGPTVFVRTVGFSGGYYRLPYVRQGKMSLAYPYGQRHFMQSPVSFNEYSQPQRQLPQRRMRLNSFDQPEELETQTTWSFWSLFKRQDEEDVFEDTPSSFFGRISKLFKRAEPSQRHTEWLRHKRHFSEEGPLRRNRPLFSDESDEENFPEEPRKTPWETTKEKASLCAGYAYEAACWMATDFYRFMKKYGIWVIA